MGISDDKTGTFYLTLLPPHSPGKGERIIISLHHCVICGESLVILPSRCIPPIGHLNIASCAGENRLLLNTLEKISGRGETPKYSVHCPREPGHFHKEGGGGPSRWLPAGRKRRRKKEEVAYDLFPD